MVNYDKEDSVSHKMSSTDMLQCKAIEYELAQISISDVDNIVIKNWLMNRIEEYKNGKKV